MSPAGTTSQKARHVVAMFDILSGNRNVEAAYDRLLALQVGCIL